MSDEEARQIEEEVRQNKKEMNSLKTTYFTFNAFTLLALGWEGHLLFSNQEEKDGLPTSGIFPSFQMGTESTSFLLTWKW